MSKIKRALINKIKIHLFTLNYLPLWMVFFMDIFLTLFSSVFTFFIVKSLSVTFFSSMDLISEFIIILFAHAIFFFTFKTYSGIISYSTFIDGLKLLYATFSALIFLVVFNYAFNFFVGNKVFLFPYLIINFIVTFSILFLFRIFIKFIFENLTIINKRSDLMNAVVYGSDANSIAIVNALRSETPARFSIVGFIDKRNLGISNRILNIPILNSRKKIPVVLRSINAEALIIADNSLSKEEKFILVEECLEYNIKVFTAPTISNFENEKEISKKVINFKIQDLLERNSIVLDQKPISKQLNNKTILITGAAGSIGSEIVRQVIHFNPKKIIILDQSETPLHYLKEELLALNLDVKLKTVICDIRDKATLKEIFRRYTPEVVFHAAAYKHVPMMEENPSQAIITNVLGTKNTADLSLEFGVANFVFISTDKAVNPSNVMGASKRIAEKYIQSLFFNSNLNGKAKTKFITTRFGNVLGSSGSVVPLFTEQIQNGGPITITHPDIIRYFMTIPEACQLVLEAGAMGKGGEIFIFDMGKPVKIIDLANKMIRLAGLVPEQDIKIKIVGLRPGEKLYEELLNDNSKTLPTHNDKILIVEDTFIDFSILSNEIDALTVLANEYDTISLVLKMKSIVPEFISMNSQFNELDN